MGQHSDVLDDRPGKEISEQWIEFIPSPKWVRVVFNGKVIADSKGVQILRESGHTPVYYFPKERCSLGCPATIQSYEPIPN